MPTSCNSNRLYKHQVYLPNNIWNKKHKVHLKTTIEQPTTVDLVLNLRLVRRYPYPNLRFELMMQPLSDSTIAIVNTHNIPLRDSNGQRIGAILGDIWDVQVPLQQRLILQKGVYEYEFNHTMRPTRLRGVTAVGLIIQESEAK